MENKYVTQAIWDVNNAKQSLEQAMGSIEDSLEEGDDHPENYGKLEFALDCVLKACKELKGVK